MSDGIVEALQWAWTLLGGAFVVLWRRDDALRRTLDQRLAIIQSHETQLAVLKAMQEQQNGNMDEIKSHLRRIEEKLDAKADK